jgi:hypothetical protein
MTQSRRAFGAGVCGCLAVNSICATFHCVRAACLACMSCRCPLVPCKGMAGHLLSNMLDFGLGSAAVCNNPLWHVSLVPLFHSICIVARRLAPWCSTWQFCQSPSCLTHKATDGFFGCAVGACRHEHLSSPSGHHCPAVTAQCAAPLNQWGLQVKGLGVVGHLAQAAAVRLLLRGA